MKETKDNRSRWLHLRLSPKEHDQLQAAFKKTTERKLSDYARKILLGKPIIAATRDRSLDDFMAVAIRLKNELNSIGNNYNQAVKRLHTLQNSGDIRLWLETYETDRQAMNAKVEEAKNFIQKVAEKWLQL